MILPLHKNIGFKESNYTLLLIFGPKRGTIEIDAPTYRLFSVSERELANFGAKLTFLALTEPISYIS